MIHHFVRIFGNGKKYRVSIDLSTNKPTIFTDIILEESILEEYKEWRKDIADEILSSLNMKQFNFFIKKGFNIIKKK